jgi:hypothetical protein
VGVLGGVALETRPYDYNSNTWENLTTATYPSERFEANIVYDSQSEKTILYGGVMYADPVTKKWYLLNDTWELPLGKTTTTTQSISYSGIVTVSIGIGILIIIRKKIE